MRSIPPITYADKRGGVDKRLEATDEGIIFKHGFAPNGSDKLGVREAFVYKHEGKYYMTYDGISEDRWSINEAVSTDLKNWIRLGTVLDRGASGAPDGACAAYGTLYNTGKSWNMYYLGCPYQTPGPEHVPSSPYVTMLAHGDSPTGPWTKDPIGVVLDLKPNTYYSHTASPGQIIKQGNEYLMFFTGGGPVAPTIGIARTTDLNGKWQIDPEPLLPPSEFLENASLYYQESDNTWFMFTNHIGINEYGYSYTDAIWVYWTKDLNNWSTERKAVVVDGTTSTWSKQVIGLPSVMQIGDRLAIFYDGREQGIDQQNLDRTHITRDIGLAWVELPIKP